MTEEKQDRRKSSAIHVSDESINKIVEAVCRAGHSPCKFSDEEVLFIQNFNRAMADSRTVVRRFLLVTILAAGSGYMVYGFWAKITDTFKKALGVP